MRDDVPAPEHASGFVIEHGSTSRVATASEHGAEQTQRAKWHVGPRAVFVDAIELTIAVRGLTLSHPRFYHACSGQKSEPRPPGATCGFDRLSCQGLDLVRRMAQVLHEQSGRT